MRLDKAVLSKLTGINRSNAQRLIRSGKVLVNNRVVRISGKKISETDQVKVNQKQNSKAVGKIKIEVIYEDKDCIVLDKPEGVLTHSKGAELLEPTVASWLAEYLDIKQKTNRDLIVHRLDRGTSGVIICAKNDQSHKFLQKQFSTRKVEKTYIAIVSGRPKQDEAIIEVPVERDPKKPKQFRPSENGKLATTHYKVIEPLKEHNLYKIQLSPTTGRTHQIRVHMNYIGHPILGDELYGGIKAGRIYLHVTSLQLKLSSGATKKFTSKLPPSFANPKIN